MPIDRAPLVDLLDDEPLEIELATTLLYEHCHYSYRQIRQAVESIGDRIARREIIDLGLRHRGRHDEMLRAFRAGQQFRFDILMDIGGFRDMHRHRRCIQIGQEFTTATATMLPKNCDRARHPAQQLRRRHGASRRPPWTSWPERRQRSREQLPSTLIPLGFRKRTLFKMDFAEAVYISELRTGPAGHFSYRNVAYAMYEAVAAKHPAPGAIFPRARRKGAGRFAEAVKTPSTHCEEWQ